MDLGEAIVVLKEIEKDCRSAECDLLVEAIETAISYLEPIYNGEFTTDSDDVIADMGMVVG